MPRRVQGRKGGGFPSLTAPFPKNMILKKRCFISSIIKAWPQPCATAKTIICQQPWGRYQTEVGHWGATPIPSAFLQGRRIRNPKEKAGNFQAKLVGIKTCLVRSVKLVGSWPSGLSFGDVFWRKSAQSCKKTSRRLCHSVPLVWAIGDKGSVGK